MIQVPSSAIAGTVIANNVVMNGSSEILPVWVTVLFLGAILAAVVGIVYTVVDMIRFSRRNREIAKRAEW